MTALMLRGNRASRGIAIARAHRQGAGAQAPPRHGPLSAAEERSPLEHALHLARQELEEAGRRAAGWPRHVRTILDSHLRLLEDPAFARPALTYIDAHRCTAEEALQHQRSDVLGTMDHIDDPYLCARRAEVDGVFGRLMIWLGAAGGGRARAPMREPHPPDHQADDIVLVCADPAPADLLLDVPGRLVGLVSERGGPLSHTTIVARSLGLPYVAGVPDASSVLADGDSLIVDGDRGLVLLEPDAATLAAYRERQRRRARSWQLLSHGDTCGPAKTADGARIEMLANVRGPGDITLSRRLNTDGIGLYRTEFLYANRDDLPDEEEHFETYQRLCRGMDGAPVTIRTLDACAGPQLRALLPDVPAPAQPSLGLRALRLCLRYPALFEPQVRAILRVAAHAPVRMLLPMVTSLAELRAAQEIILRCREGLAREGVEHARQLPVGVMIEVPAAALCAGTFARHAAFLSIGTNDLVQYTLAIDRDDENVQSLYEPAHPAVLRLILMTIEAARGAGTAVSLCGEMAGDPRYTRLLLGMGLESFSMSPVSVPEVRAAIAGTRLAEVRRMASRIAAAASLEEASELLETLNATGPVSATV